MGVYTLRTGNGGYISSEASSFSDALSGAGTLTVWPETNANGYSGVGHEVDLANLGTADYVAAVVYCNIDISSIGSGDTIDTSSFSALLANRVWGAGGWLFELYAHDWGDTLTDADWVSDSDVAGMTLLASWDTDDYTANTRYEFDVESALSTAVAAAKASDGTLRTVLVTSKFRLATEPTSSNWFFGAWGLPHAQLSDRPTLTVNTLGSSMTQEESINPTRSRVVSPVFSPVKRR